MYTFSAYLPDDRYRSLLHATPLRERTTGAALFADISGFTPLTEALTRMLGPRRGAEELTRQLNQIYDALIAAVSAWDGDVISFSGDGITCWFDDQPSLRGRADGLRGSELAVAAGLALLATITQFSHVELPDGSQTTFALKVAVASGTARRFLVGDPDIQRIDVLAGDAVTRVAMASELVQRGELLVDQATVDQLGSRLAVVGWRHTNDHGTPFAIISSMIGTTTIAPPALTPARTSLPAATLRSWLLPPIYNRLHSDQGELLTELRPATALFLSFGGIAYEQDPQAEAKLDHYICAIQRILARYDSYLLQFAIGDKGSYLYAAFGAPSAHEDDVQRAVHAALDLRDCPAAPNASGVQIGISQGLMRAGAYGSVTRRIYGVMGDPVNLAARLMSAAAPGTILATESIQQATSSTFAWQPLPPLRVKGKREPVAVAALLGKHTAQTHARPPLPQALPLIGRTAELVQIQSSLGDVRSGRGQIIGITADAGVGKSHLLAEVVASAQRQGFVCYSGECQSYGTNTAYLVWQSIWRDLFQLPASDVTAQIAHLHDRLAAISPALLPRLPLLGPVLDLPIPDTELTSHLDQQIRKVSCEALLIDCLKAYVASTIASGQAGVVFVLEDIHWLDPLSHDLLETLAQAISALPVLILIAYRPPELARLQQPRVMGLPHATLITLSELGTNETAQLIQHKLHQHGLLAPNGSVPPDLVLRLTEQGQGNPFYTEELLNFLLVEGLDLTQPATWTAVDLPASLHSLMLSRMDQLSERRRTMLKVASIIGRLFQVTWLAGYYPALGFPSEIVADLEDLCQQELTLRDLEANTASNYLFKHVITQMAAYESLAYATRETLHEQFAQFLEAVSEPGAQLDLLAYHYVRSTNQAKQREYLRRAAEAAESSYANEGALDYYRQLLPLLDQPAEQIALQVRMIGLLERIGRWPEGEALARTAYAAAQQAQLPALQSQAALALGKMLAAQGHADAARTVLAEVREHGDPALQVAALIVFGQIATDQGAFTSARDDLRMALALNELQPDGVTRSRILSKLSWVAFMRGEFAEMRELALAALDQGRRIGSLSAQAEALRRLGMAEVSQLNFADATAATTAALELYQQIGDREGIAASMHNIGQIYRVQQDYPNAIAYCDQGLALFRELGGRRNLSMCLFTRGAVSCAQANFAEATTFLRDGLELALANEDRWVIAASYGRLATVALATGDQPTGIAYLQRALHEATSIRVQSITLWTLIGYAQLWCQQNRLTDAAALVGMVLAHPAAGSDAPILAQPVIAVLRTQLASAELEAALAHGRTQDLATTVAAIQATN